jgi:hypothetical protein
VARLAGDNKAGIRRPLGHIVMIGEFSAADPAILCGRSVCR